MSNKLQRAVDGQTIQFLNLPRIFSTLSADLPSGAVKLVNGDTAYWRLHRNLTELKKNRKDMKGLTLRLAQAFKTLVGSDAFLNHYGLSKAPEIEAEAKLQQLFRTLLSLNTSRVDYSTINHGVKKPLVESITIPLGNLVFFNAYRGVNEQPKVSGVKGKMWLAEGTEPFVFTVVSPTVNLADFISPDKLRNEILSKIKLNLPLLIASPVVEFDDGQFENYVGRGLEQLAAKNGHELKKGQEPKGKQQALTQKKAPEVRPTTAGIDLALSVDSFATLDDNGRAIYIENICDLAAGKYDTNNRDQVLGDFLRSGILEAEWKERNANRNPKLTHRFFLFRLTGLGDDKFNVLLGKNEPRFINEPETKAEEGEKPLIWKVDAGDTLSAIALEIYGDAALWPLIHNANKEQVKNPDHIEPGWRLVIPKLVKGAEIQVSNDLPAEVVSNGAIHAEANEHGIGPDVGSGSNPDYVGEVEVDSSEQNLAQLVLDQQQPVEEPEAEAQADSAEEVESMSVSVTEISADSLLESLAASGAEVPQTLIDTVRAEGVTLALQDLTYEVQSGDTLFSIAEQFYGNGNLIKRIADANDGVAIIAGTTISVPAVPMILVEVKPSAEKEGGVFNSTRLFPLEVPVEEVVAVETTDSLEQQSLRV